MLIGLTALLIIREYNVNVHHERTEGFWSRNIIKRGEDHTELEVTPITMGIHRKRKTQRVGEGASTLKFFNNWSTVQRNYITSLQNRISHLTIKIKPLESGVWGSKKQCSSIDGPTK